MSLSGKTTAATWDETYDVVIVGSGFAGLAAAMEAIKSGAKVCILEKMPVAGGNSIIDAGEMSVVGSPQQRELHIHDTAGLLAQDMLSNGEHLNDPEKVRYVAERAHAIYEWTVSELGVEWSEGLGQAGGHSVPRTITTYTGSGYAIHSKMTDWLTRHGQTIKLGCYVEEVIRHDGDRVEGVQIREGYEFPNATSGTVKRIKAKLGVILCHGGFSADVKFRSQLVPGLGEQYSTTNQPGATGELWREAKRIGCMIEQADWVQCTPWNNPKEPGMGIGWIFSEYAAACNGIWINQAGVRFVNEMSNRKQKSEAIFEQHRRGMRAICLANEAGTANLEKSRPGYMAKVVAEGIVKRYETLAEVEKDWGIPEGTLSDTIKKFNSFIRTKQDPQFGRNIRTVKKMIKGPWFGSEMSPKVHHCLGGILTTKFGEAIDAKTQSVIPGLYAAGECSGGVHGVCRMGSCAILDCLVIGRAAGEHITEPLRNSH